MYSAKIIKLYLHRKPKDGKAMKHWVGSAVYGLVVSSVLLLSACSEKPLESPESPAVVQGVADNWSDDQAQRKANKA
ncbi:MAG: hypothetical protein ACI93R_002002 [Flavobacteriales bacterium]|jgi:hypothetical protein